MLVSIGDDTATILAASEHPSKTYNPTVDQCPEYLKFPPHNDGHATPDRRAA